MRKLKQTHDILLHLLDELPEAETAGLRSELLLLYGTMAVAFLSYESVSEKIRAKASVQKRTLVSRLKENTPV
jgi:protein subunit release factor B